MRSTNATFMLMLLASAATGQPVEDAVVIAPIVKPKELESVVPDYPKSELNRGGEGIVQINFMVDEEGHPFDPAVTSSRGSSLFHDAALDAVMKSTFIPAQRDGRPITGAYSTVYRFSLREQQGASSRSFARNYRKFSEASQRGNREQAQDTLDDMVKAGANNHYEDAYLNLAQYLHFAIEGDAAKLAGLAQAALSNSHTSDDPVHLPADLVTSLRRDLFQLQVHALFYYEALQTYALIEATDSKGAADLASRAEEVRRSRDDGQRYGIPVSLDQSGRFWMYLFKPHVAMSAVDGNLLDMTLRCGAHHFSVAVEADIAYDIDPDWGDCSVELTGDPETTFTLVQF